MAINRQKTLFFLPTDGHSELPNWLGNCPIWEHCSQAALAAEGGVFLLKMMHYAWILL